MMFNQIRTVRPNAGFILPGSRFLETEIAAPRVTAAGEFKLIKHRNGIVLQETPWFDNIILDAGLNRWGTGAVVLGVGIGTGTSTPTAAQTGLDAESHWTTTGGTGDNSFSSSGGSPHTTTQTRVFRTTLGVLNGNYSELATGWAAGNNKFSRALILDGGGSPTTIAVSSVEQLDIYYRLSVYPPLVDTSQSITISGVTYTVTGRATSVEVSTSWGVGGNAAMTQSPGAGGFHRFGGAGSVLGAVTSSPSSTNPAIGESKTYSAYVDTSLQAVQNITWPLTVGNGAGGVQTVVVAHTNCAFQYHFNPVLPKDSTKTLSMSYRFSWARRP